MEQTLTTKEVVPNFTICRLLTKEKVEQYFNAWTGLRFFLTQVEKII
jgi:hypothetical protein